MPELKYSEELCNACGSCISLCPEGAIRIGGNGSDGETKAILDREKCTNCLCCVGACYCGALAQFGTYYTVDELFNLIERDLPFYRTSGGGVTIGGGEASFQPVFTCALIKKCKEHHIHTAVDTCGYTTSKEGLQVLEEADLLLFDLKGLNSDIHLQNTGVANDVILDNLRHLDAIGKPMIIRIPLICGYTETDESIRQMANLLASMKHVERVDLIAFHEFGKNKYQQLGKEYTMTANPYTENQLAEIKDVFTRRGLNVQLGG
jgi:pyruvate formate lyase activating enzyme